jgi:SDR family mycofactocin-dependent oxidoreductase
MADGRLKGKVALVSGAARGTGRAYAVKLAQDGANIIGFDICKQINSAEYPLGNDEDLAETQRLVALSGQEMMAARGDVRDMEELQTIADQGAEKFGRLDIVIANAGITPFSTNKSVDAFGDAIDVMLTGVYNTVQAAKEHIISGKNGGSIVLISSLGGLRGVADASPGVLGYCAAKSGILALMRNWAIVLAEHYIRVNTLHPGGVETPKLLSKEYRQYAEANPGIGRSHRNVLPVESIKPEEIAEYVSFICSEEARFITGQTLVFDAGSMLV